MRLAWLLGLLSPEVITNLFYDHSLYIFFLEIVEGIRRAQWALIRVENENCNNFERYRTILEIPQYKNEEEEEAEDLKDVIERVMSKKKKKA